jgi:uncharacterized protein (TIGR00251 family)
VSPHRFAVRVKPGASKSYVGGSYGTPASLIVSVNAQPVDGKASEAVIAAIAEAFDVRARDIEIVSGHTARTKHVVVTIDDDKDVSFQARFNELLLKLNR